jgi:Flp pilus assembly protein TadD
MSRKRRSRNKGLQPSWQRDLDRARRFYSAGRLPEALALAKKIAASQPDNAEALVLLGSIAHADKQHYLAENFLRRALTISPDSVAAHNRLGHLLRETGDLEGAEEAFRFRKAVALQPGSARPLFDQGPCHLRQL